MKTISRIELEQWQDNNRSFALIDVQPSSLHPDRHRLEKRTHEFLEKIFRLGIRSEEPIVLYEGGSADIDADAAADILMQEGFHEVYCFAGPQCAFYGTQHDTLG
ncbi:hypothetical protein [Prosthecobacter sp.]|uniref:hypothetical protein n=1 Tax=Prosthecobacter sp. TaxID=1965333 RepID=UPI003783B664